jgi:sec-independent protein translocase protein TatC
MICLLITPQIVAVLERPLKHMRMFEHSKTTVTLEIGKARFGPFEVTKEEFPALTDGASPQAVFNIGKIKIGNQQVLTLVPDLNTAQDPPLEVRLHNLSPSEAFFTAFHVALYAAIIISSPFWIYFLGSFIVPAFKRKERKSIFAWVSWGVLLALAGVMLTYFLMLPIALRASMTYSNLLGFDAQDWRADEYISFVCKFLLGMGLGFQFPLVVLIFVKMGILSYAQLAKFRRHVIVISLVLGAVLTTPEVITQVAMAVPLYILYEVCIWIAWYWEWKKRKANKTIDI